MPVMSVILNSKKIIVMRIISNSQYYTWYPRRWTILLHRSDPGITRGSIERYFKHPPANVQSRSNISRWTKFSSCSSFAIRSRDIGRATKDSIQSRGVTCSRFRYPCITCRLRGSTRCARVETTGDDLRGYLMQIDDRIKHAGRKRRNENGICRILFATRNIEIVDQSFGRAAITNLIKLSIIFTLPKNNWKSISLQIRTICFFKITKLNKVTSDNWFVGNAIKLQNKFVAFCNKWLFKGIFHFFNSVLTDLRGGGGYQDLVNLCTISCTGDEKISPFPFLSIYLFFRVTTLTASLRLAPPLFVYRATLICPVLEGTSSRDIADG